MSGVGDCRCDLSFYADYLFNLDVQVLCNDVDWRQNSPILVLVPKEYRSDFKGLLMVGFDLMDAFETLKETYKFG